MGDIRNQRYDNYKKRGDLSSSFWKINQNLISTLAHLSQNTFPLDIRLRGGHIHVYYRGGKILEMREKCLKVDYKYLKTYSKKEQLLKKWFEGKSAGTDNKWTLKREAVANHLLDYLKDMIVAMDAWFSLPRNRKDERNHQQRISTADQPQIRIIDIEFSVSFNSHCYNVEYILKEKEKREGKSCQPYERWPNPRFDLIGIDDDGQIHVFELKTGLDATGNMMKHITDFVNLIGSEDKDEDGIIRSNAFLSEMQSVVSEFNNHSEAYNKKVYPTVNEKLSPKFYFIFTDKENESKFDEFQKQVDICYRELENGDDSGQYKQLIARGILNKKAIYIDKTLNYIINLPK